MTDTYSPRDTVIVTLNVYDLHESNSMLHSIGLGFYHSGIEIEIVGANGPNTEYSFSPSGVSKTRPRLPDFGELREQISMGTFSGGIRRVNEILGALSSTFRPGAYNVTTLNCNSFSDAFCVAALEAHIPDWVNRVASVGARLNIDPSAREATIQSRNNGSSNSSSSSSSSSSNNRNPPRSQVTSSANVPFAAPGRVAEPQLPVKISDTTTANGSDSGSSSAKGISSWSDSVFSFFGWGSSSIGRSNQSGSTSASAAATAATSSNVAKTKTTKPVISTTKKELTEEQKALLAKMKSKK